MFGSAYWSTYKRIEQEVLELSHSVCFDDNQLKVYSNEILDLIVRICTNIESLYEDIYRDKFSKTEPKIGPMITKLNEMLFLEDKIICVANDNFRFHKEMKEIKPFKYKNKNY